MRHLIRLSFCHVRLAEAGGAGQAQPKDLPFIRSELKLSGGPGHMHLGGFLIVLMEALEQVACSIKNHLPFEKKK